MNFSKAITWAVDKLRAAGLNACADPADLNTPGIWVAPDRIVYLTLSGDVAEVTMTLYLVTGSGATPAILNTLDSLAAAVASVIELADPLEAITLSLPNHNLAGMPAYRTTVTLTLTEGEQP